MSTDFNRFQQRSDTMIIRCSALLFALIIFHYSEANEEKKTLIIQYLGVNITFSDSSFESFYRFLCIPERHHCSAFSERPLFAKYSKVPKPTQKTVNEVNIKTVLCLGSEVTAGQPERKCEVYLDKLKGDYVINCTKSDGHTQVHPDTPRYTQVHPDTPRYTQTLRYRNDSHILNKLCPHGSVKLDWPPYVKIFVNTTLVKEEWETPLPMYTEYISSTEAGTGPLPTEADTQTTFTGEDIKTTSAEEDTKTTSIEPDTNIMFVMTDIEPQGYVNFVIILTVLLSLAGICGCIFIVVIILRKKDRNSSLASGYTTNVKLITSKEHVDDFA